MTLNQRPPLCQNCPPCLAQLSAEELPLKQSSTDHTRSLLCGTDPTISLTAKKFHLQCEFFFFPCFFFFPLQVQSRNLIHCHSSDWIKPRQTYNEKHTAQICTQKRAAPLDVTLVPCKWSCEPFPNGQLTNNGMLQGAEERQPDHLPCLPIQNFTLSLRKRFEPY